MRFGYACLNMSTNMSFKTCRLATFKKYGVERIKELTLTNLRLIYENLKWNIEHNIKFYRFTSNVIPLATHEELYDKWDWENDSDVINITKQIKEFVVQNDIRLTLHPSQYSPLNTLDKNTLLKTIRDFNYQYRLLDMMGGSDMITHVGGVYGDKEKAKIRFAENFEKLDDCIKRKLRLENDDKVFNVEDVLDIYSICNIPICLDIHHHNCNPSKKDIRELFDNIVMTWNYANIMPKAHISTGKNGYSDIAHADYVSRKDLENFLTIIGDYDIDIMFESKMKELSVLKLIDLQRIN